MAGNVGVLIAARTPFMRRLLRTLLDDEYAVVGVAETGVEAIDLVEEHRPAAVVLGANLPIKDGLDTATTLREEYPGVGVVVCTAEDAEAIDRALDAGAAVVVEPFERAGLLEAVRAARSGR